MPQTDPHQSHAHGANGDHPQHSDQHAHTNTVRDPVCGMNVDPAKTQHHADHQGVVYHFCAARCREKFLAVVGWIAPALESTLSPAPPEPITTPDDTLRRAGISSERQAAYQRRMSSLLAGRG